MLWTGSVEAPKDALLARGPQFVESKAGRPLTNVKLSRPMFEPRQ
jgi:hypothetical protein